MSYSQYIEGSISYHKNGIDEDVEWQIANFSTLSSKDGAYYYSPFFSFKSEDWYLGIYPNGWSERDSSGYVDLRLYKYRDQRLSTWLRGRPVEQSFSLSLKMAKGEKLHEQYCTKEFDNTFNYFHEFIRFISRSELTRRRSDLVPDDVLTIVCTMKRWPCRLPTGSDTRNNTKHADVGASAQQVDVSIQTMEASVQTVEVSTQTLSVKSEATTSGSSANLDENKLHQDFKQLFLNKEDCDIIIKVKGSEFPAHRAILKARSPVFASTFRHDMKENATGIVEIEDCDPSSFSDFLCFIYCGGFGIISQENVFGLFTASDKYQVLDLRAKCLEFMKQNLSVDTFCETLTLALRHSEAELIRLCTDYFKQNVPKIIVTVNWQTFLAENPTESNELLVKSFVPNSS